MNPLDAIQVGQLLDKNIIVIVSGGNGREFRIVGKLNMTANHSFQVVQNQENFVCFPMQDIEKVSFVDYTIKLRELSFGA